MSDQRNAKRARRHDRSCCLCLLRHRSDHGRRDADLLADPVGLAARVANVPTIATEEYGKRLSTQTSELLGPDVADPKMRYTGSRLACGSCHLGLGPSPAH